MSDNTYHRWLTFAGSGEPGWAAARAHVWALAPSSVRDDDGELLEWAIIDETLALDELEHETAVELARVRAQLASDLADLQRFWSVGHPTVRDETTPEGRTLLAGGELGPDWEYPNDATGALARLIGTGTARAAGFREDQDGSEPPI